MLMISGYRPESRTRMDPMPKSYIWTMVCPAQSLSSITNLLVRVSMWQPWQSDLLQAMGVAPPARLQIPKGVPNQKRSRVDSEGTLREENKRLKVALSFYYVWRVDRAIPSSASTDRTPGVNAEYLESGYDTENDHKEGNWDCWFNGWLMHWSSDFGGVDSV